MILKLVSCDAQRPDKRAIAQCIATISAHTSESLALELTEILLEGDPVEIKVEAKNTASVLRALRKLEIDYEIMP